MRVYKALEKAERERETQGSEGLWNAVTPEQRDVASQGQETAVLGDLEKNRKLAEYQRLRGALQSIPEARRGRGIVVCSSVQGEGASTVAADLARICALHNGAKVLLVDAAIRHPNVHRRFRITRQPGLVNVLEEGRPLSEKEISQSRIPGLFLLPAGDSRLDPTTAFESERCRIMLCHLGEAYDYVILDSGPVHSCPETLALAEQASGVVLVVRAERTRVEVVQAARDQLLNRGAHLCGVVLNRRKYYIPGFIYRRL